MPSQPDPSKSSKHSSLAPKFTPINPAATEAPTASASSSNPSKAPGELEHIHGLSSHEKDYLLGKAQESKGSKDRWLSVADKCNKRWKTSYTAEKFAKTVKYLENEVRRETKREKDKVTGQRTIRSGFGTDEDQEIVSLLANYGWLTWPQISEYLRLLTKSTEAREVDGVRVHFNVYIIPDLFGEENRDLLQKIRAREITWKVEHPGFESKIKEKYAEKPKRNQRPVTIYRDGLPQGNADVVVDEKKRSNKLSVGRRGAPAIEPVIPPIAPPAAQPAQFHARPFPAVSSEPDPYGLARFRSFPEPVPAEQANMTKLTDGTRDMQIRNTARRPPENTKIDHAARELLLAAMGDDSSSSRESSAAPKRRRHRSPSPKPKVNAAPAARDTGAQRPTKSAAAPSARGSGRSGNIRTSRDNEAGKSSSSSKRGKHGDGKSGER